MPNNSVYSTQERECLVFHHNIKFWKKRRAPALNDQNSQFCDYIKDTKKIGKEITASSEITIKKHICEIISYIPDLLVYPTQVGYEQVSCSRRPKIIRG